MPTGGVNGNLAQPVNLGQVGNHGVEPQHQQQPGVNHPNPQNARPMLYYLNNNAASGHKFFHNNLQVPRNIYDRAQELQAGREHKQVTMILGSGNNAKIAQLSLRGVTGANNAAKAQRVMGFVQQGQALLTNILNGNGPQAPSKDDLNKLMWYFHALGSAKAVQSSGVAEGNGKYKEGALNIEDPNGRLKAFFDGCNSYPRASTHMHGYQSQGEQYKPRGVDLLNRETPHGRHTFLYQKMPPQGPNQKNMLFIKMESAGCRRAGTGGRHRLGGLATSTTHKTKRGFSDVREGLHHFGSLLKSKLPFSIGINNKERIPSGMLKSYRNLYNQPTGMPNQVTSHMKNVLKHGGATHDSGGVKQMLVNIANAKAYLNGLAPQQCGQQVKEAMLQRLTAMETQIRTGRDHLDMRIGNEIIVTSEDLANMVH
jgi:hypothetical protein